jgi:DNA polymerase III subunit epsilon
VDGFLYVVLIIVLLYLLRRVWTTHSAGPLLHPLSVLPERFVVFDLETTGLDSERHEIIEIGAIRVSRDSDVHDTFRGLIRSKKKIPKKITELTGITQAMLERDGQSLDQVLTEFRAFIGELPLVAFNAKFDLSFLRRAIAQCTGSSALGNPTCCALEMARQAWPGRKSYRLAYLAQDGGLSSEGTHRALSDCHRCLIVYAAAARKLGYAA